MTMNFRDCLIGEHKIQNMISYNTKAVIKWSAIVAGHNSLHYKCRPAVHVSKLVIT